MKYIRTKDRIMTYEELQEYGSRQWLNGKKVEILKQADTIEELCDVAVVKYNYENLPKVVETMKNSKIQIINALKDNETVEWIKLGIYTDKGLIYVAKMNGKGVLELL